jgi:hypothetical protein
MISESRISAAKVIAMIGFSILVVITYWLRSEVLGMSRIHFSADEKKVELERQRSRESFPERQTQYEVSLKNYEIERAHYEKMMEVYQRDLEEYANLTKDRLAPPQVPQRPEPPRPPEVEDEFQKIQSEFAMRRYRYFVVSEYGNWIACLGALLLAGGLLYLLMFDVHGNRLLYFMLLAFSFLFLIGPSLQSVMSALIGLMHAPHTY